MAVLTTQQRNGLESIVIKARTIAEIGARNALLSLAIDNAQFFSHMSSEQKALRNRLRSKARLLGDELPSDGKQQIDHLANELAYEYWHKMLFAKFLEANGLLIHSDSVAVTMDECEELAVEEGYSDKWNAAAAYASKMLPAIFRVDDPLMQIEFATEDRIKLESLLDGIENEIFTADDALGWVYQFWQSEAKDRINKSGDKIDGEKLPAVTQLFTEPYMVHFLVDNTVGAWWVTRNPGITSPIKFEYLRPLENGKPAAGSFEGWPDKTANITSLDPCMGSGHFIVSLFTVFAILRMHEEGLTKEEATDKVIKENLYGLEIDPRCTQIAAFNLALTAWKFCGHYKVLPEMNLACSGIAPKGKKEDWVKLVDKLSDPVLKARMGNGMNVLYDHFQLAPELGSLINPSFIKSDVFTASFEELQPTLKRALESELDEDLWDRSVMAAGIAKAGLFLAKKYNMILTNVPYLGFKKQGILLKNYCEEYFEDGKMDLSTVFLQRCIELCSDHGFISSVTPQNWLFLGMYEKYRVKILRANSIQIIVSLGSGAFSQISGEVVKASLVILNVSQANKSHDFVGISCSHLPYQQKERGVRNESFSLINQESQLNNPDSRILFKNLENLELLDKYAISKRGVVSGDKDFWFRCIWEIDLSNKSWKFLQSTMNNPCSFGGKHQVANWFTSGNGMLRPGIENEAYNKKGVVVNQMGELPTSIYLGELYDNNVGVIVPQNEEDLLAIYSYCSSEQYHEDVRDIDQSLAVTNATLVKVPFNIDYWRKVAQEKFPYGLPEPYSDDPTQWLFHGNLVKTDNPLQVTTARFVGYRWPAESDAEMELAVEARELIQSIKQFDNLSDEDGIVCIPSVNGELPAADRLRSYLQSVFGDDWHNKTITALLEKECAKKTNLDDWLREEFFEQHCKLFQNRPFIWHIWDGRKDGFSALVHYHKLTKENLQKLIYTYLGDWIRQCESKKKSGESGAEGLLSAALKLKEKLEAILIGEDPLDIFVRWKLIEEQPIGWDPDLNDGVRLNIRPFILADVLRKKPNIKWGVDRGKNRPGSPWGEIRDNDKHLTLEEKKKAREK